MRVDGLRILRMIGFGDDDFGEVIVVNFLRPVCVRYEGRLAWTTYGIAIFSSVLGATSAGLGVYEGGDTVPGAGAGLEVMGSGDTGVVMVCQWMRNEELEGWSLASRW